MCLTRSACVIVLLCFLCHRWKTVNPLAAHHAGYAVRSHEEPHRVPLKLWYTEVEVYLDDKGGFDSNLPAEDNAGHGS